MVEGGPAQRTQAAAAAGAHSRSVPYHMENMVVCNIRRAAHHPGNSSYGAAASAVEAASPLSEGACVVGAEEGAEEEVGARLMWRITRPPPTTTPREL